MVTDFQAPFLQKSSSMTPYWINEHIVVKDDTAINNSELSLKSKMPIAGYSHFKSENLTCVWMGLRFSGVHP